MDSPVPTEGVQSTGFTVPRAVLAMSRPAQFREFWRLLGRFEELTVQESLKIQRGDFESMEISQREKVSLVRIIQELGARLGLDRGNPDLRLRLEALEAMERRNCDAISQALISVRGEQGSAEKTRITLRSLRGSYLREPASGEFFAEG